MTYVALAALGWALLGGLGWAPGPLAVTTRALERVMSRLDNSRSDPDPTSDDDTDTDVDTTPRSKRLMRPLDGPRDLDDLRAEAGIEDDGQELPPRREWVAARMRDGWRAKDIDEEGAAIYGCSTQTIFRERKALSRRGRGTMEGRP